VLGGFIIGFIQQISDNRDEVFGFFPLGSAWTPAVVFAYLILIMTFKPSGLLGEQTRDAG
jgi:branched-chain amino acid transport system permease protein